jgi:AraC-like DNA-binding protein
MIGVASAFAESGNTLLIKRNFQPPATWNDTVLRTDGQDIPPGEIFWGWRDSISPLFDVAVASPEAANRFSVDLTAVWHAGMVVARFAMPPLILRRSPTSIARSFGADHILVIVVHAPAEARDGSWRAEDGDLVLLDLSQPCHFTCSGFRCDLLVTPRRLLEPHWRDTSTDPVCVFPRGTPTSRLLGGHISALLDGAAEMDLALREAMGPATLHLLAAPLNHAATGGGSLNHHKSQLTRIRAFIEDNLDREDLTPALITSRHGVSRATLYRLFEPIGGVADYIRRRRLAHCFADIASPAQRHRSISDIAYSHGFFNDAAFSRSFSAHFGLSPRRTRQAALHGRSAPPGDAASRPSALEEFRGWLLRL